MGATEPAVQLARRFSSPDAVPTPWEEARGELERAGLYWLSTVRPDGRPHVTPLIAVWVDEALYFCTGPDERKARNIMENRSCVVTTGCSSWREGIDVVVEGRAVNLRDEATLQQIAGAYLAKYGEDWRFTVRDGAFLHEDGGTALVFEVAPSTAFAFGKGERFSQTRYRFASAFESPPGPQA